MRAVSKNAAWNDRALQHTARAGEWAGTAAHTHAGSEKDSEAVHCLLTA